MSIFSIDTAERTLSRTSAPFKLGQDLCGGHITFVNGWTVSIQWSTRHYCHSRDLDSSARPGRAPDSPTAEIALWRRGKEFQKWEDGDTVQGWLTWGEVQHVLDLCEDDKILRDSNEKVAVR